MSYLLSRGADPALASKAGYTPLKIAQLKGLQKVVALLKDAPSPATAARRDELFGVLKAVVEMGRFALLRAHLGRDDMIRVQRRAVMHGHNADLVGTVLDDHGLEAASPGDDGLHLAKQFAVIGVEHQAIDLIAGDDDELRGVDGIGALAQDGALGAFLAALRKEGAHVKKIGRGRIAGQSLRRGQRCAVAGENIADLALRNGHQRLAVDAKLKGKEEVVAAAQYFRLKTGLFAQGYQAVIDRTGAAPQFFNNGDTVIADIAHTTRGGKECKNKHKKPGAGAEHDHILHGG